MTVLPTKIPLPAIFKDACVRHLFPQLRPVIAMKASDSVEDTLWKFSQEQILSAPVFGEDGKISGVVDMLDFCLFAIALFPKDASLDHLTEEQVDEVVKIGRKFRDTPLSDVLQLSNAFKKDYQHTFYVTRDTSVPRLMELFFGGVHRVLVTSATDVSVGEKGLLLNQISQSDLLSIIAQSLPLMESSLRSKTVKELDLGSSEVIVVSHKKRAIDVLYSMNKWISRPILSAVPVVDDEGKLVANFSASNLKGVTPSNFANLLLPVVQFLKWQPETSFHAILQNSKSLHPVKVTQDSTFEEVVQKIVATRVHRVWVVDDEDRPIGVIAIGDLFRVFLPF